METPEQRAERNRRTAERMRQRRAKIAEERGIVRAEPRTSTLSAARFEEIFQVCYFFERSISTPSIRFRVLSRQTWMTLTKTIPKT